MYNRRQFFTEAMAAASLALFAPRAAFAVSTKQDTTDAIDHLSQLLPNVGSPPTSPPINGIPKDQYDLLDLEAHLKLSNAKDHKSFGDINDQAILRYYNQAEDVCAKYLEGTGHTYRGSCLVYTYLSMVYDAEQNPRSVPAALKSVSYTHHQKHGSNHHHDREKKVEPAREEHRRILSPDDDTFFNWLFYKYLGDYTAETYAAHALMIAARKYVDTTNIASRNDIPSIISNLIAAELEREDRIKKTYDRVQSLCAGIRIDSVCKKNESIFELVRAIVTRESEFDPLVISPDGGAVGLFQFQDQTWLGVLYNLDKMTASNPILAQTLDSYWPDLEKIRTKIIYVSEPHGKHRYTMKDGDLLTKVLNTRKHPEINTLCGITLAVENGCHIKSTVEELTGKAYELKWGDYWLGNIISAIPAGQVIAAFISNPAKFINKLMRKKHVRVVPDLYMKCNTGVFMRHTEPLAPMRAATVGEVFEVVYAVKPTVIELLAQNRLSAFTMIKKAAFASRPKMPQPSPQTPVPHH